jgi:hypothetical protein
MKLMQKILSHGLLIGFFVASFFTYLYRAELFPQWFGDTTRTAALPDRSQPVAPTAAPKLSTGGADTAAVAESQSAAVDLPSGTDPGEEAPTPHSGVMQDTASDLPPLVSALDVDQAPPQVLKAAPDAAPSGSEPEAGSESVTDSAWGSDLPPPGPARYRPLDQEPDTVPTVAVENTVQDAVAPPTEQENVAAATAPVQAEPLTGIAADRPAVQTASEPPSAQIAEPTMATVPPVAMAAPEQTPVQVVQPATATEPPVSVATPDVAPVQVAPPNKVPANNVQEFQQQLAVARNYFWRRDLRGALQAYQNLARAWPAQADVWGELGNLYLRIGNRPAAAEAYYRAMTILLDQGESERAHDLLEVLYGLDATRASEIEKRFRQASS